MLHPDLIASRFDTPVGLASIPAKVVFLGLAKIAEGIAWVLALLLFRESQRAEYLADRLAAEVAGTNGAVSMLEAVGVSPVFYRRAQGLAIDRRRDLFSEWKAFVADLSSGEAKRLRESDDGTLARLDATHPPTQMRIDLLRAHPISAPRVAVSASEQARIDAELQRIAPAMKAKLADAAEDGLYY